MTTDNLSASSTPTKVNGVKVNLKEFLSPSRVATDLHLTSKKRALEETASMLATGNPGLNKDTAFQTLIDRERLGSTGIGNGVALPHGRVSGLDRPIMAAIKLRQSLDFDSIDNQPVELIVGLLIPPEADETHLKLLAHLAGMFQKPATRERLKDVEDVEQLYQELVS